MIQVMQPFIHLQAIKTPSRSLPRSLPFSFQVLYNAALLLGSTKMNTQNIKEIKKKKNTKCQHKLAQARTWVDSLNYSSPSPDATWWTPTSGVAADAFLSITPLSTARGNYTPRSQADAEHMVLL